MKKILTFIIAGVLIIAILFLIWKIIEDSGNIVESNETETEKVDKPLNISIFLDLSDRITRDITPSQMSRDTAIVANIVDFYKSHTLGPQILQAKNSLKVFFYPIPDIPEVAKLADELKVEMDNMPKTVARRERLESMKQQFLSNLNTIYSKTLEAKKYPGCDIWDFFSSKKVDEYCIQEGSRNILIVVTDGYLFDERHKIQEGNAYSYVTAATLKNPNSSLIVKRDGLGDLEVMMLEVNPLDINHRDHLIAVLNEWLTGMGIKKENIKISETSLPTNTKTIINNFLKK